MTRRVLSHLYLLAIVWIAVASIACAGNVTIPDPALRTAIQSALGLGAHASISSEAAETLTMLLAGRMGIQSLRGLEAFVNLAYLQLHENEISDLTPLKGLTSLQSLTLYGNRISDVSPLSELQNLTSLALHGNRIVTIGPLRDLTSLESLSAGNLIEDLSPLRSLPRLRRLVAFVRPSTELSPLVQLTQLQSLLLSSGQPLSGHLTFDPALLSNCRALSVLQLHGYRLSELAELARAVPSLSELSIQYGSIDDPSDLESFPALRSLNLDGSLPASDLSLSRFQIPSSVTVLSLQNNGLNEVAALTAKTQLTSLNVSRNQLSHVSDLATMTNLRVLDLSFNPIADLSPLSSLTNLKSLTLVGVPFDQTEGSPSNSLIRELRHRGVNIIY